MGAHLVIQDHSELSTAAEARQGARPLARLLWTEDGRLGHVQQLDSAGKGHGLELEFESGKVAWCAQWVHGKQHGFTTRFDTRGQPLIVSRFVRGRGTDIWTSGGKVTEVRGLLDGRPHGWVRWGDPKEPWEEEHYHHGQRHGVFRQWTNGDLRRGFPHFYLNDVRVTRRAYLAAQARDSALPGYDQRDDSNRRSIPAVVREAIARARLLRGELALLARIQRLGAIAPSSLAPPKRRRKGSVRP